MIKHRVGQFTTIFRKDVKREKNYTSAAHIVRLNSNETCGKNSSNVTRIWYPPGGINAGTCQLPPTHKGNGLIKD